MSGGRGRSCGSWNIKNLTKTLRIELNFREKFDLLSKLAIKNTKLLWLSILWVQKTISRKAFKTSILGCALYLFRFVSLIWPEIAKCSQWVLLHTDEHYRQMQSASLTIHRWTLCNKKSLQFEPRQIDWCFQSLFKVLSAIIDLVTHKYK